MHLNYTFIVVEKNLGKNIIVSIILCYNGS
jgi:hypothetical protein